MPLNNEIASQFIVDKPYHYKIKVVVEGPCGEERDELIKNLSFDVDSTQWEFSGYPEERSATATYRTVFVRRLVPWTPSVP